jgi:hypothetical protein
MLIVNGLAAARSVAVARFIDERSEIATVLARA